MFNDIAKKLTGITTDLIKSNHITSGTLPPAHEIYAMSKIAQNQEEENKGRFKLGQKENDDEKGQGGKKKKKCCKQS